MARREGPTPVDSLKHQDERANIPTNELRGFVEEAEQKPDTMLYPRDPSLDPQLVWKGKDSQDVDDLEVPVAPFTSRRRSCRRRSSRTCVRRRARVRPSPNSRSLATTTVSSFRSSSSSTATSRTGPIA
jgi:adenine-specific DNA-methyltransferase